MPGPAATSKSEPLLFQKQLEEGGVQKRLPDKTIAAKQNSFSDQCLITRILTEAKVFDATDLEQ
ncbi:MAG: hypothetical protein ACFB0E_00365 [Leptolyngbyaceae cyanobacterium]